MIERTEEDDHSVVGDECHIHSGAPNGPRHDPSIGPSKIDEIDNLLLLCRVHHKMVDDQFETYTDDLLRSIKGNHEKWIESKFNEKEEVELVRVVRIKGEIPERLPLVESGHELLSLAIGCHGSYPHYSDGLTEEEVELVGGFLQSARDWIDVGEGLEPIEQVRAGKSLSDEIAELKRNGFRVFAARERQQLRGGVGAPSNFYVLHLAVVREGEASGMPSSKDG